LIDTLSTFAVTDLLRYNDFVGFTAVASEGGLRGFKECEGIFYFFISYILRC
jgi:hypothetical protein